MRIKNTIYFLAVFGIFWWLGAIFYGVPDIQNDVRPEELSMDRVDREIGLVNIVQAISDKTSVEDLIARFPALSINEEPYKILVRPNQKYFEFYLLNSNPFPDLVVFKNGYQDMGLSWCGCSSRFALENSLFVRRIEACNQRSSMSFIGSISLVIAVIGIQLFRRKMRLVFFCLLIFIMGIAAVLQVRMKPYLFDSELDDYIKNHTMELAAVLMATPRSGLTEMPGKDGGNITIFAAKPDLFDVEYARVNLGNFDFLFYGKNVGENLKNIGRFMNFRKIDNNLWLGSYKWWKTTQRCLFISDVVTVIFWPLMMLWAICHLINPERGLLVLTGKRS
ncbi:MAG: hypothetical protein AB7F40_11760 [Victivallaceae bacterium]|nr:hypothetical protein [Victivallaceae bacterium]